MVGDVWSAGVSTRCDAKEDASSGFDVGGGITNPAWLTGVESGDYGPQGAQGERSQAFWQGSFME